ncbi:MAG: isoprenyl transferase [Flavobacteriales bacterium]|nr:isoprenyl transferase [Flavobacteriales bacterium]
MAIPSNINPEKVPQHVAIIMDGNGRWAKSHGHDRIYGHLSGVRSVRESLEAARELGVKYLTLYAFSTENWNRPKEEVEALMDLLVKTIVGEIDELDANGVRLDAIGDIEHLPESCKNELQGGIDRTKDNSEITLILALSYSSRWEIVEAIKRMMADGVKAEEVNDNLIATYLCTKNIPDPELMIRTSGEQRISNFLLWQLAYSELYFTETYWPEFRKADFFEAIAEFQGRERRFGKTSEQIILKDK